MVFGSSAGGIFVLCSSPSLVRMVYFSLTRSFADGCLKKSFYLWGLEWVRVGRVIVVDGLCVDCAVVKTLFLFWNSG